MITIMTLKKKWALEKNSKLLMKKKWGL